MTLMMMMKEKTALGSAYLFRGVDVIEEPFPVEQSLKPSISAC